MATASGVFSAHTEIASVSEKRKAFSDTARLSKRARKTSSIPSPNDEEHVTEDTSDIISSAPSPSVPPTPQSPAAGPPSQQKKFLCTFEGCEKSFNRPAKLTEHLRSHTNERPYVCDAPGCGKTFLRENHLSQHYKSAHTDVRDHVCDIDGCGKAFLTATRLKRHKEVHETGGRERYHCKNYPPCNESFRKHITLQRHIRSAHLDQKPFPCNCMDPDTGEQCKSGFDKSGDLKKHQARVHAAARFFCTECALAESARDANGATVGFSSYGALQEHIRTVHPPTCRYCSQTFTSARQLNQHLETVHDEGTLDSRRTHICEYPGCGRGFTKKSNLTVHKRTVHEGERKFVCGGFDMATANDAALRDWDGGGACGLALTSKAALEDHCRTKHLGLKGAAQIRKEKRGEVAVQSAVRRKRTKPVSAIGRLTGVGYDKESGRDIACLDVSCSFKFVRQYDLEVHMRSAHGLVDVDVEEALAEREALSGGRFWIGGFDEFEEEDEADHGFADERFDLMAAMRQDVSDESGQLAGLDPSDLGVGFDEEMRKVLGTPDEDTIDPALRSA